jgi:hypothetical protein
LKEYGEKMNYSVKTNFEIIDMKGIKLYRSRNIKKYKVLFASLFHGDENCFDVIYYYMRNEIENISISLIPIVNGFGFLNKTRNNDCGENINNSFYHPNCTTTKQTKESNILIENIELIKECSRDGYASLHINKKSNKNYSHIWLHDGNPSKKMIDDLNVVDYNLCYNTLEDYLWHEGIPITACIEYTKEKNDRIRFTNKFLEYI